MPRNVATSRALVGSAKASIATVFLTSGWRPYWFTVWPRQVSSVKPTKLFTAFKQMLRSRARTSTSSSR